MKPVSDTASISVIIVFMVVAAVAMWFPLQRDREERNAIFSAVMADCSRRAGNHDSWCVIHATKVLEAFDTDHSARAEIRRLYLRKERHD